jgi:hypothetical protein
MNPLKISAQFAAYTWYMEKKDDAATTEEGLQFARENSKAFASCAHEGLGRLLIRLAVTKRQTRRPRSLATKSQAHL